MFDTAGVVGEVVADAAADGETLELVFVLGVFVPGVAAAVGVVFSGGLAAAARRPRSVASVND